MNHFIKKVVVAALVVTVSGVAGASQSRADTSLYSAGNWVNSYSKTVKRKELKTNGNSVVVLKSYSKKPHYTKKYKSAKKHHRKERSVRKYGYARKKYKHGRYGYKARSHRFSPHASRYRW